NQEAGGTQRAVRRQDRREDQGLLAVRRAVVGAHGSHYTGTMARKTVRKPVRPAPRKQGHKRPGKPAPRAVTPRSRKPNPPPAVKRPEPQQVAADQTALAGELPQWTKSEIEEAFRRFKAAMPEPKGELQYVTPFTLLVAVVLSAQATDAGVNKATP